jgi:hypothetical protein
MAFAVRLRLLDKVLGRRAQPPRPSTLLNPHICTFYSCLGTGPAGLATAATDLPNLASIAGPFGYTRSGGGHDDGQLCERCILCSMKPLAPILNGQDNQSTSRYLQRVSVYCDNNDCPADTVLDQRKHETAHDC